MNTNSVGHVMKYLNIASFSLIIILSIFAIIKAENNEPNDFFATENVDDFKVINISPYNNFAEYNRFDIFFEAFYNSVDFPEIENGVPIIDGIGRGGKSYNEFELKRKLDLFKTIRTDISKYNLMFDLTGNGENLFEKIKYNFNTKSYSIKSMDRENIMGKGTISSVLSTYDEIIFDPQIDIKLDQKIAENIKKGEYDNEFHLTINCKFSGIKTINGSRKLIIKPNTYKLYHRNRQDNINTEIYNSRVIINKPNQKNNEIEINLATKYFLSIIAQSRDNTQYNYSLALLNRAFQYTVTNKSSNTYSYVLNIDDNEKLINVLNEVDLNIKDKEKYKGLFENRNARLIEKLWLSNKEYLFSSISSDKYKSIFKENVDNLVNYRLSANYKPNIIEILRLYPEPNLEVLNKAYEITDFSKGKELAFWYRRSLEKNDEIVLQIFKDIQKYYDKRD